jgi:hypothetical protein
MKVVSSVFNFSVWLARAYTLVLLIFAVAFCRRSYNPRYMRSFPLYAAVNLLSEVMVMLWVEKIKIDYFLFTCFELVYFAWFLTMVTDSWWMKRVLWTLVGLALVFLCWHLLRRDLRHLDAWADLLEAVILIMPCLVYFREIFLTRRPVNLLQEPSFWMVTGVLFYMFLRIPVILFADYAWYRMSVSLGLELYAVNNYALIIIYTLFIKAMTCRRKVYS